MKKIMENILGGAFILGIFALLSFVVYVEVEPPYKTTIVNTGKIIGQSYSSNKTMFTVVWNNQTRQSFSCYDITNEPVLGDSVVKVREYIRFGYRDKVSRK